MGAHDTAMTPSNSKPDHHPSAASGSPERLIIALDGPAGAGKSTVAKRVAQTLGVRFLDTGAMYRAVTLKALENEIDPSDSKALGALVDSMVMDFTEEGQILVGGCCLEPAIRTQEVTSLVSEVSAHGSVREAVVARQQELGHIWPGLVAEGRDTTTVVFDDAAFKFYIDASSLERAKRRAKQEGREEQLAEIQADIERRDHYDSNRELSPLCLAKDAHLVNTDGKSIDEVVDELLAIIHGSAGVRA
jgi:cytidylate kinase